MSWHREIFTTRRLKPSMLCAFPGNNAFAFGKKFNQSVMTDITRNFHLRVHVDGFGFHMHVPP